MVQHYGANMETPWEDLQEDFRRIVMDGSGTQELQFGFWRGGKYHKYSKVFEGVVANLKRRYEETDSDYMRQKLSEYMSRQPCTSCDGSRMRPETLACRVSGKNVVEVTQLSVKNAIEYFNHLDTSEQEEKIAHEVIKEIRQRLSFLANVGLDYLTLDRESGSLSGGEAQRIRLATQIGAGLVGVLYVLDEPSIGLHQRDNEKLIATLKGLRDIGNTVVVVEHDDQTIREADYVIDLGPGAGRNGGYVVHAGTVPELLTNNKSLTARYLNGEM
ncbi:MAG: excinuclease ABC subunit UvrA, partial [Kiritimatiellaeota bacterium]|nr:excinuclease ABC subunit UvrA [Kiritimatiellota bacterium]